MGRADLRGALFSEAALRGADLHCALLHGAFYERCDCDGLKAGNIVYDRRTLFTGSNLDGVRIYPEDRGALEHNIRRDTWERWRDGFHRDPKKKDVRSCIDRFFRTCVLWFWSISDYGTSTTKIFELFVVLACIFAAIYWMCPFLLASNNGGEPIHSPMHAFYFAVVTLTTLGFGDIHANADSWIGQVVLVVNVICGYLILGSVVTRFGVVYTGLGPVDDSRICGDGRTTKPDQTPP